MAADSRSTHTDALGTLGTIIQATSAQFWEDLAIYKGISIPQDKRDNFFSCSC